MTDLFLRFCQFIFFKVSVSSMLWKLSTSSRGKVSKNNSAYLADPASSFEKDLGNGETQLKRSTVNLNFVVFPLSYYYEIILFFF